MNSRTYTYVFAALLAAVPLHQAQAVNNDCVRTLNISGKGQIKVMPDTVSLKLAVSSTDVDANEARIEVEAKVGRFLELLDQGNLADKETSSITADNIAISPVYGQGPDREREITSYKARRVINITLYNINLISTVTTLAVQNGINEVYGIEYRLRDERAIERAAMEMAIRDAQSKATQIARNVRMDLGPACEINYIQDSVPYRAVSTRQGTRSRESEPSYIVHEISIDAQVDASFELID